MNISNIFAGSISAAGKYFLFLMAFAGIISMTSCSESNETEDEFENWQERNDKFFNNIYSQAETAIKKIEELKAYLESLNKAFIADMTDEEIAKAVDLANEAAGVVGAKLSFAKGSNTVSYTLQGSDKKDESSKAAPAGDNPIKTTGLDVPGVAAVAGVAVLAVSAAGIYVISTSKKKETVGA